MTVSSESLLQAIRVPSRSENSRSHAVQRSRSMSLCVPVHDRCTILPSPGRLNWAQCGFGHENRVYLSCAGVVSVIPVLLWQGIDCKIRGRRQFRHVTILQDYLKYLIETFEELGRFVGLLVLWLVVIRLPVILVALLVAFFV